MENYAQQVKEKLLESIQSLESLKRLFVLHPDKDFTRQRELSFETMLFSPRCTAFPKFHCKKRRRALFRTTISTLKGLKPASG